MFSSKVFYAFASFLLAVIAYYVVPTETLFEVDKYLYDSQELATVVAAAIVAAPAFFLTAAAVDFFKK